MFELNDLHLDKLAVVGRDSLINKGGKNQKHLYTLIYCHRNNKKKNLC